MIALVACCGQKLATAAPARELYVSPLFRKASAYASRKGGRWFILSALHGLLAPDDVIAPYDCTLLEMSADSRAAWGRMVFQQLRVRGLQHNSFLMLAGAKYADPLRGLIGFSCPLAGMGIGKQLHFLGAGA